MPLNKKQIEELKKILLAQRDEILRLAGKEGATDQMALGDLVDQTSELIERDFALQLAEHDRERLLDVDEALQRIEDGSYGICLESGEEIPYERLKAVPTAKYTVRCQEMLERRRHTADY